jgi:hypothetical protein
MGRLLCGRDVVRRDDEITNMHGMVCRDLKVHKRLETPQQFGSGSFRVQREGDGVGACRLRKMVVL